MSLRDSNADAGMLNRSLDNRMQNRATDIAHFLLRVVTAALFMQHGLQKLFGVLLPANRPWSGAPDPFSQPWIAGVLETFGAPLLALGILTRPLAFLLAGEMAVAYFKVHAPRSFFPTLNSGEIVVLFCFVFLFFAAAGAGPYSVDALLTRRRKDEQGNDALRSKAMGSDARQSDRQREAPTLHAR